MSSTYHECVDFPYNRIEICILGDNTLSINLISVSNYVPLNREENYFDAS